MSSSARLEGRMLENFLVQGDVGLDAFNDNFRKRITHAGNRGRTIVAMGNNLAQSSNHNKAAPGSRCRRDFRHARRKPPGACHNCTSPGEGMKFFGSSALMRHSIAWPRKRISSCDRPRGSPLAICNCCLTISMPVIISVTGVFHLQSGVHLDKIEFVVLVQKLESACAAITQFRGRRAHIWHQILLRCSSVIPGAGASSTTF